MNEAPSRRTVDQGIVAVAAKTAAQSSKTFWMWVERHHVDSLAILVITLWLTIRVVEWAMDFADSHSDGAGGNTALIIGAVLGPWGLLQGALFKFYSDSKTRTNGQTPTP